MQAVQILENAILVREHYFFLLSEESPTGAFGTAASRTLAAAPGLFALSSVNAEPDCSRAEAYSAGSSNVVAPPSGAENCRSTCGPGFGARPAAISSSNLLKLSGVR